MSSAHKLSVPNLISDRSKTTCRHSFALSDNVIKFLEQVSGRNRFNYAIDEIYEEMKK